MVPQILIKGKALKIASVEDEWFRDVDDPEGIIDQIKQNKLKADVFTFWQRLPETEPKYDYHMEWDNVAALKLTTFDHWWSKQINAKTRNLVRKAEKKGVETTVTQFNDKLVSGICGIFNETPIRQGRRFWHYGKAYETVKREMSDRLEIAEFIGAYLDGQLIGFSKLLHTDRYTMMVEIISMIGHRDKSPTNALIAKAVEVCSSKGVPFLVYSRWATGGLERFKKNNGFRRVDIPRYYVPLNVLGKIGISLNLHHDISSLVPDSIRSKLKRIRTALYLRKYREG